MDDDKNLIESIDIPAHEEVKPEPIETPVQSTININLKTSPKLEKEDTNCVSIIDNLNGNENNVVQKRIKTEEPEDDRTSKKRRMSTPEPPSITMKEPSNEIENMSDAEEYYLTVSNLPEMWSYVQIKNYLDEECGHVDEMEMIKEKNSQNFSIRLTFQSSDKCKEAFMKLDEKVVQEKKLEVKITKDTPIIETVQDDSASQNTIGFPSKPWRPDEDFWAEDPEGLYGLRPQYLSSLNITPPISNLVHVTNFRCDKTELREVMNLAGDVIMCCVVAAIQRYAKVMYSHPIEAVQAIAMLNGQMFYGNPLKITLDKTIPDTIVLPKGLAGVGLGLGLQGRPIRNIAVQYERYAKKQCSLINPIVFSKISKIIGDDNSKIDKSEEEDPVEVQKNIKEFMKTTPTCLMLTETIPLKTKNIDELDGSERSTPETNITKGGSISSLSPKQDPAKKLSTNNSSINPLLGNNPSNPAPNTAPLIRITHPGAKNVPRHGLLQNPPVPMRNPLPVPTPGHPNYGPGLPNFANQQQRPPPFGLRPGPFMPRHPNLGSQPMPPFGPAVNFGGPRPFVGPNPGVHRPNMNPGNRVTVNFSNLPPSTTFPFLCEQLAQCGQVMSVQLTTPGCAVATFGHPSHADRCFQTFNRMNVEGYIIEVKYA